MKRIAFLSTILIISTSLFSQTLIDETKSWSTVIHRLPSFTIMTENLKLDGDTVIESEIYKKVFRSTDQLQEDWIAYGFIRETDQQKVYYRSDTSEQEYLFYDFGANLTDTVYISSIYNYGNSNGFKTTPLILSAIDEIQIGDIMRTQYHLNVIDEISSTNFEIEHWVAGIGSLSGLLHITDGTVGNDGFELLCYSESTVLLFQNPSYNSCYQVWTDIDDNYTNQKISIFPNPSNGIIRINIDELNSENQILIINSEGRIVYATSNYGGENLFLNQMNNGIYLLKYSDKNKTITKKFVIIK